MKLYDDKLIVLTGGAGFIGSSILKVLNDNKLGNIIVFDMMESTEKWKNLVHKRFLEYYHRDQLFDWLEEPSRATEIEAVIHMGAVSSTVEKDVDYYMRNNYQFTVKLAEYCLKHNIKFIYASSSATYGDGSLGFSDDHDRLEELRPLNAYGFSKHLFDLWAKQQKVLDKITGLKFTNVFGPNETHKERMASVICRFFPVMQKDGVITLFKSDHKDYKDGDQVRDFIYVKDVAEVVVEMLKLDAFGIYNVGSGVTNSWNNLARSMFKAVDRPPNIAYFDMPADLHGKYQSYTCADISKLQKVLPHFQPTPLPEAIADYIQNYLVPNKGY